MIALITTIVAWYAVVTRVIEAIAQWWNQNGSKITDAISALKALWQVLKNFLSLELYKK